VLRGPGANQNRVPSFFSIFSISSISSIPIPTPTPTPISISISISIQTLIGLIGNHCLEATPVAARLVGRARETVEQGREGEGGCNRERG
jgi:hypothetical protein